jgi:hypothetical protein
MERKMIEYESALTWEYRLKERKRHRIPSFFGKRYIALSGPGETRPEDLLPHIVGVFEYLGEAGNTAITRATTISEITSELAWYGVYDLVLRQLVYSGTLGDLSGP